MWGDRWMQLASWQNRGPAVLSVPKTWVKNFCHSSHSELAVGGGQKIKWTWSRWVVTPLSAVSGKLVSTRVPTTPGSLQRSRSDIDVNAAASAKSRLSTVPASTPFSSAAALPPGSYASLGKPSFIFPKPSKNRKNKLLVETSLTWINFRIIEKEHFWSYY